MARRVRGAPTEGLAPPRRLGGGAMCQREDEERSKEHGYVSPRSKLAVSRVAFFAAGQGARPSNAWACEYLLADLETVF